MNIEELLAYALDNDLNETQQVRLEQALAESNELQQLQDELFAMRSLIEGQLPAKNKNFVQDVLQQLPLEATITQLSAGTRILRLFPRVAAACVFFIGISYIGLHLGDANWISDQLVGTAYLSAEEAYTYIDTYK